MPIFEPTILQPDQIKLRHIGPRAAVWPTSPAQDATVLGRTDMVARPLPISNVPANPDFASGSWTLRLDDAGECSFVFPNVVSSDGLPWRERFDPSGHNQFLEVTYNWHLEGVFCIDTVTPTQQQVTVHGQDGWFLLKKAYVRDLTVVQAPRDVIERGTQVWVPVTVDNFPPTILSSQWTNLSSGGGTVSIGTTGGLAMAAPPDATAEIGSAAITVPTTGTWRASCWIANIAIPQGGGGPSEFIWQVIESSGNIYGLELGTGGVVQLFGPAGAVGQAILPPAVSYGLLLESDGEWIWGFCNGQMIGCVRRTSTSTTSIGAQALLQANSIAASATVSGVLTEALQPFLMP